MQILFLWLELEIILDLKQPINVQRQMQIQQALGLLGKVRFLIYLFTDLL